MRLELGFGDEPIADLWTLVRDRDVNLAFRDFGRDGGDGLYRWNGETALIVANSATSSRLRQRFTVAHELGHHELHRPDAGRPLVVADKNIFGRTEPIEQEANAFAGHLLIPDPGIVRSLREWQVADVTPEVVAQLMQRFGVSYDTAAYRLHNVGGIINAGDRDRLLAAKREQGVRTLCERIHFNEFLAFPLPGNKRETVPEAFETDVIQAFSAHAIDEERLAELLRLPRSAALERVHETGIELSQEPGMSDEEFEALLDEE